MIVSDHSTAVHSTIYEEPWTGSVKRGRLGFLLALLIIGDA
jgi:hypothetical protein